MGTPILYQSEDWTDFRRLPTLTRKAGVPRNRLARLVIKELADNGFDRGSQCWFGEEKWNSPRKVDRGLTVILPVRTPPGRRTPASNADV